MPAREKGTLYLSRRSESELHHVADSHGFSLDKVTLCKIAPPELAGASGQQQYKVFQPAEVELADVLETILARVRELAPARVVIDSMSELRMLARDSLRYRRQILALKHFFEGRDCTTLLLDERARDNHQESQVQTIAHGVISLEVLQRNYGATRRRLEVLKVRASAFREGFHDYVIEKGGIRVFPRLISGESRGSRVEPDVLPSGIEELDDLFHGGVQRGTSTLIVGPTGCGKSTLCAQFAVSAARRRKNGAIFLLTKPGNHSATAAAAWGWTSMPISKTTRSISSRWDPAELSPGEFIDRIRRGVVERGWRIVVVDSLNGLMNSMSEEHALAMQLHEVLSYLNQRGVASFLVLAQYGLLGTDVSSPADVSYLADNVLLLRYFEAAGEVRQALSVMKRRSGPHERSIREMTSATASSASATPCGISPACSQGLRNTKEDRSCCDRGTGPCVSIRRSCPHRPRWGAHLRLF